MLLFADLSALTNPVETVHLPPLIVLHHIVVLSPLLLPHQVHQWSEAEYLLWLQKHDDQGEQLGLLEKAIDEQLGSKKLKDVAKVDEIGADEEEKYVKLCREVLANARMEEGDSA